jgi:hypothetical protein
MPAQFRRNANATGRSAGPLRYATYGVVEPVAERRKTAGVLDLGNRLPGRRR